MKRDDLREMRAHTSVHYWPGPTNDLKEPDWYEIAWDLCSSVDDYVTETETSKRIRVLARLAYQKMRSVPYEP